MQFSLFSRRCSVGAAVVSVVLAAACTSSHPPPAKRSSSSASASAPARATRFALPRADVATLTRGLSSSDKRVESVALAASVRKASADSGTPLLPRGSRVTVQPATAVRSGRFARVRATVTGPRPGVFDLLLTSENGRWVLLGTERIS